MVLKVANSNEIEKFKEDSVDGVGSWETDPVFVGSDFDVDSIAVALEEGTSSEIEEYIETGLAVRNKLLSLCDQTDPEVEATHQEAAESIPVTSDNLNTNEQGGARVLSATESIPIYFETSDNVGTNKQGGARVLSATESIPVYLETSDNVNTNERGGVRVLTDAEISALGARIQYSSASIVSSPAVHVATAKSVGSTVSYAVNVTRAAIKPITAKVNAVDMVGHSVHAVASQTTANVARTKAAELATKVAASKEARQAAKLAYSSAGELGTVGAKKAMRAMTKEITKLTKHMKAAQAVAEASSKHATTAATKAVSCAVGAVDDVAAATVAQSAAQASARAVAASTTELAAAAALSAGSGAIVVDLALISYDAARYMTGLGAQPKDYGVQLKHRVRNLVVNASGSATGAAIGTFLIPSKA